MEAFCAAIMSPGIVMESDGWISTDDILPPYDCCNHGHHTMEALCAAIMSPGIVMEGDGWMCDR